MLETAGIAKSHLEGRTVGSRPFGVWSSHRLNLTLPHNPMQSSPFAACLFLPPRIFAMCTKTNGEALYA